MGTEDRRPRSSGFVEEAIGCFFILGAVLARNPSAMILQGLIGVALIAWGLSNAKKRKGWDAAHAEVSPGTAETPPRPDHD